MATTEKPPAYTPSLLSETSTVSIDETTDSEYVSPTVDNTLIEPTLDFNFDTIRSNIQISDQALAKEVIRIIAERAKAGVFAHHCWGYAFFENSVHPSLCCQGLMLIQRPGWIQGLKGVDGIL